MDIKNDTLRIYKNKTDALTREYNDLLKHFRYEINRDTFALNNTAIDNAFNVLHRLETKQNEIERLQEIINIIETGVL